MKDALLRALRKLARPLFGTGLWRIPGLRSIASWYTGAYRPEFVEIEGSKLYLNYDDGHFSTYVAVHGYFEKLETEIVRKHVRPGMCVLDIGANLGYFTLLMSSLVGETGRVIAFEPDTTNLALLTRSVRESSARNIEVVPSAVWHSSEPITIYLSAENHGDHRCWLSDEENRSHYAIDGVAIDEKWAEGLNVDFIKMDIQGSEGHALAGMRRTLEYHPPKAILMEFWPHGLREAGTPPEEVYAYLVGLGYRSLVIDDERERVEPITLPELLDFCDLDWKFRNLLWVRS